MTITPKEFVNVKVRFADRTDLIIVNGVAIVDFTGATNDKFLRDQVTFIVPKDGATNPADPASALQISGSFAPPIAIVFPTSVRSGGAGTIGWAVDRTDAVSEGQNVRVTALLAIQGSNTILYRVGFQVIIF